MEDKEKWRIWRKRWRDKNKEKIKEYNAEYNKTRKKKPKTTEELEKYRKYQNEYHKEYQKGRGKEKYNLRMSAYKYFRKKIIEERKKCEECGSMDRLELHHLNYEANIEQNVKLLCMLCHKKVHTLDGV